MRKIFSIAIIALAGFFISCDKNEVPDFDQKDAFVAFDRGTMSVNEDAGIIKIPVTLATITPFEVSVNYSFEEGSAKLGDNFNPIGSQVINFTTDPEGGFKGIIEVEIINVPEVFTGDLSFKIALDAGSVSIGAESTCTITIQDLDHPLSSILGEYTTEGAEGYWDGPIEWDFEILKDATDVSLVWFLHFEGPTALNKPGFYGRVNAEKTEIYVPLGQANTEYSTSSGDGNIYLFGINGGYIYDEGNIVVKILDGGARLEITEFGPATNAGGTNSYFEIISTDHYFANKK